MDNNKIITRIDAVPLAIGIQKLLLEMYKKYGESAYPIKAFEQMIMNSKNVSIKEAERVTEKVINTGIIRRGINHNAFIL